MIINANANIYEWIKYKYFFLYILKNIMNIILIGKCIYNKNILPKL